ncbi:MAG: zinc ribbon domain-containing protein [Gemmatimonadaceae bacterium]
MDDVERMYRHLVRTIRNSSPQLLTQPFQVADLYATILPYRLHRRDLGLETNQDYEMAMLELLSGAREYLVVEPRMREVLGGSLKSPNPDPQLIREFASSRVSLAPETLRELEPDALPPAAVSAAAPTAPAGVPAAHPDTATFRAAATGAAATTAPAAAAPATARPSAAATSPSAPSAATRRASKPITIAAAGQTCPHCKGELPAGRQINFCPHCGQDLTVEHCPACGSELEHGWKFCVTCGRAVAAG